MFERTLQVAARLLSSKPSSALPVRSLWESVSQESRKIGIEVCSLPDFAALLEADPRFEFVRTSAREEDVDDLEEGGDEALSNLGFMNESTVCLRRRIKRPPDEDVDEMPSISTRHLSETSSAAPHQPPGRNNRTARGKTVPRGPSKAGGKRRSR